MQATSPQDITVFHLAAKRTRDKFDVETIIDDRFIEFTAPRWCKRDDIVFFMHAISVKQYIGRIKSELKNTQQQFTDQQLNFINTKIVIALNLYNKYGGKIFAIGRVLGSSQAFNDEDHSNLHWKDPIYAPIGDIFTLERSIPLDNFKDFIKISQQSSITPVLGKEFDQLKGLISKYNELPDYLSESKAIPLPIKDINEKNWLSLSNEHRRDFFLEIQYRTYYVNHLLRTLGDQKKIYSECACKKEARHPSFIDNVILFDGKYLPVEVKLNFSNARNLEEQLRKYCFVDKMILDNKKPDKYVLPEKIHSNFILTIDTSTILIYDYTKEIFNKIIDLDLLKNIEQIKDVKSMILGIISNSYGV